MTRPSATSPVHTVLAWLSKGARLALLGPIWLYRHLVSPLLPQRCRYYPSCSAYAEQAI